MTEKIRKGLGGLCVAAVLALVGAALLTYGLAAGGIAMFFAILVAIASLSTVALDLLR